jgi:hypothetical protein
MRIVQWSLVHDFQTPNGIMLGIEDQIEPRLEYHLPSGMILLRESATCGALQFMSVMRVG